MQEKPICFFCGLKSDYLPSISGQNLVGISCRRCGNYYLDGFLAECGAPNEENEKKILRGYTRWEHVLGNSTPIITADLIEIIIRDNRDYSDETKVDKLLLYYSGKHPDRGSDIEFISDLDFPITFSKNSAEFIYLLEKVADESLGYIKMRLITSGGPPEGYFQILPKGWDRIDWLKKIKLADDKYEIEKQEILASLYKAEMQLKEEAGLTGTRWSSGLARGLRDLYLRGSLDKLNKKLLVDKEIIFGKRDNLDAKELEFLLTRMRNLTEFEKVFLNKKLGELYRNCHASEEFFKKDIVGVFDDIDRRNKSISIDLKTSALPRRKPLHVELPEVDIEDLIKMDENITLEFKSSFQWDIEQGRENRELRNEVIKTLAAFNNTEGGYLIIGVSDDKGILGLERDYSLFRHSNKRDFFLQTVTNVIGDKIGHGFAANIEVNIYNLMDKDICRIKVRFGDEPVWVKENKEKEVFYIRTQNSEKKLSPRETVSYVNAKWK
jgi:hypothetical protein